MVQQGKSSEILGLLYGDTSHFSQILAPHVKLLEKTYPDKNLAPLFSSLGKRIISIAPMKFCEAIARDLGKKMKDEQLAALGLHMLAISTHDDVIDELSSNRTTTAALVYAGNIASNEGSKLLVKLGKKGPSSTLLDKINENHYFQQRVVETLWTRPPVTFSEYKEGIRHIRVFIEIGLSYGLALAGRKDLERKIKKYAEGYGIALQLVDDLREIEEDKTLGYWSYPIVEGEPYKRSFEELVRHIDICKKSIPGSWKNLQELVKRLEKFSESI